ncbi:MFS transporter [Anaeromyxobacter terrae]|uniref:MFS transporter n=1 Tax=Anaeromyxobacter terrae TaxID=2925406 RepID=UPI001F57DF91|nr:MFS transporter [Anaeromyxobacter sp. SG22]
MPSGPRSAASVLVLAYVAFVSLGLPDTVLGVAWPSLRAGFGLPQAAMGAALTANVAGYFVSGLAAGRISAALGVGRLLALSTGLVAAGLAGFALAPSWPLFVACAVLVGFGSGAVDSALNTYAAVHFAPRHMNWLHACYSAGATLGPAAMTFTLAAGASIRAGYAALSATLGAMALSFLATRRRWEGPAAAVGWAAGSAWAALRLPRVWLQLAIFFAYTGLEASAGQWAFTVLRETRGLSLEGAGTWTAAYWGGIAGGRVAVGFAVGRLGPDRLVRAGTLGALAGAVMYALLPGVGGAAGLVLLGLSLAPIFPMLMSRTPARLGAAVAAHAVGFQVSAATLGMAALPSLHGALADALGPRAIPVALAGLAAVLALLCALLQRGRPAAG